MSIIDLNVRAVAFHVCKQFKSNTDNGVSDKNNYSSS